MLHNEVHMLPASKAAKHDHVTAQTKKNDKKKKTTQKDLSSQFGP